VEFRKKNELGKGRKALQNYQPKKWKKTFTLFA
jgi:hypothetical protein